MRKLSNLSPCLMLLAGIAGAWLRNIQLNTIFDDITGLAEKSAPVTIKFLILTAIVVFVCGILTFIFTRKYKTNNNYMSIFRISKFADFLIYALIGIAISAVSIWCFFVKIPEIMQMTINQLFLFLLAFLSGISFIFSAVSLFTGKNISALRFLGVTPCLFFCLWTLEIYTINRINPVLLDYCLPCLAFSSACLGFFYNAGFIFKRFYPRAAIFFNLLSIFLCTAALADNLCLPELILLALFTIVIFFNTVLFISNLKEKQKT